MYKYNYATSVDKEKKEKISREIIDILRKEKISLSQAAGIFESILSFIEKNNIITL